VINPNRIYEVKQTDFMNFGGVSGDGDYRTGRESPEKGTNLGGRRAPQKGGSTAKDDRLEANRPGKKIYARKENSESSQDDYRRPPRRAREVTAGPHLKLSETDIDLAEETCDLLGEVVECAVSLADFNSRLTR